MLPSQLNPDYAYSLGVTLEGDALSMAILDLSGTVRALRTVAMPDMSRRSVLDHLASLKIDLIREAKINERRIVGSGVGFAGFFVVDPLNFNPADLLADWTGADVAATLAPVLGPSVVCDNSATTAAIAESLLGVGRTCSNFAYCHLNNGFGGGLVFDGRVMRGANGNAGDFGGVWWLLNKGYPNLERLRFHVSKHGTQFETVEEMSHALNPRDTRRGRLDFGSGTALRHACLFARPYGRSRKSRDRGSPAGLAGEASSRKDCLTGKSASQRDAVPTAPNRGTGSRRRRLRDRCCGDAAAAIFLCVSLFA